jgi:activating signal cointegrator 1
MRAISLWQPWASLMAFGAKRYETRGYPTGLKGELAIHAAKKRDRDCLALCREEPFRTALIDGGIELIGDLPFGAIVAVGKLIACHRVEDIRDTLSEQERAFGDYRDGRFAWELELTERLETPIPAVGKQGFWFWTPAKEVNR